MLKYHREGLRRALLLILGAALLCAMACLALAEENLPAGYAPRSGRSGDFSYSVLQDGTIGIFSYRGTDTDVTIPDTLDGYTVSTIGKWLFQNRQKDLVRVVLPDTVTKIEQQAFGGCSALREIVLPRGLTEIPRRAFSDCASLTTVVFPDTLTTIGEAAFEKCRALARIDLPPSLTYLGGGAFFECESLAEIKLPAGLTYLGNGVFCGCTSLREIAVPDGITVLGGSIFEDCENLTRADLPDTVTVIGPSAFSGCESLTEIRLPSSLTEIWDYAFVSCRGLERIALPEGLAVIKDSAFGNTDSLTEVTLPASLTEVGQYVFGNSGLIRLVWTESIPVIPRYLCSGCERLAEVVLPGTVTEIGEYAFDGCRALQTVTLPDSLIKIGQRAFVYSGLTEITVPDSVTEMGECVFLECRHLEKARLSRGMTVIPPSTFNSCDALADVTIPDTVTEICSGAFSHCKSLKSIRLPERLVTLGSAFSYCKGLTEIILPESLTRIADHAFFHCEGLLSIIWPEGVTEIEKETFAYCTSLTYLYLPATVTKINYKAFDDCPLLHVTVMAGSEAEKNCRQSRIAYDVLPEHRPVADPTPVPTDENGRAYPPNADVWARAWTGTDDPASSLAITQNVDGTLRLKLRVPGVLNWITDVEAMDYETIYLSAGLFYGEMFINAAMDCRLEMRLYSDEITPGHPLCAPLFGESSGPDGVTLVFTADPAPDLTPFGVRKYVEDLIDDWEGDGPEEGPEESEAPAAEAERLFERLRGQTLIAFSGAGAWGGVLRIGEDGRFTGYYYDEDMDVIHEVVFSGAFSREIRRDGENVYSLWLSEVTTRDEPGTEGVSAWGDRIFYDAPPFELGEELILTLPGAPSGKVPETVQGEIGGTYDEWNDFSRFITLTREGDGWGFFADPAQPEDPDYEPVPTAAPTATPAPRAPMEGQVLVDDELWTLSVLGKERVYGRPAYILRIRNNSSRKLTLTIDGLIRYHDIINMELNHQDPLQSGDAWGLAMPIGSDLTYQVFFHTTDLELKTVDDLRMVDLWFRVWDAGENYGLKDVLREYQHVHLDWDDSVSLDDLFTPLRLIAPKELSDDPAIVSIQALGTYLFSNGREGILCQVANRSNMPLSVGAGASKIIDEPHHFSFELRVNGRYGGISSHLLLNDGTINYGRLQPGETARMFITFTVDGENVTNITDASFVLETSTPTQKEGLVKNVGRYVCDLHFDPAIATPTPAPTAVPEPKKLPKNVTWLSNGNLRYDDGTIAFEYPAELDTVTMKAQGETVTVLLAPPYQKMQNTTQFYSSDLDEVLTGITLLNMKLSIAGASELADQQIAAWSEIEENYEEKYQKLYERSFVTVAGRRVGKYRVIQLVQGIDPPAVNYYIPVSGGILWLRVNEYPTDDLQAAIQLFLNTLEIRDGQNAAPTAAPRPSPTAAGDVLADDDAMTVVNLGKEMHEPADEEYHAWPYYRLSVTNHLDQDIMLTPGTKEDDGNVGSVDGHKLIDLIFFDNAADGSVSFERTVWNEDGRRAYVIPAGATAPVCMRPYGGGYGYQSAEELVNVLVNVKVQSQNESASAALNRAYVLRLNEGEAYQREAFTGYVTHEAAAYGFTYEIPNNWQARQTKPQYYGEAITLQLLPPPDVGVYQGDTIDIGTVPSDFKEVNDASFIRLADIMIGGRKAVGLRGLSNGCTYYFIALDENRDIVIASMQKNLEAEFEHFLRSIRFKTDGNAPASADTPEETDPHVAWPGIWEMKKPNAGGRLYIFSQDGGPGDYQMILTMEKDGSAAAIQGSLYAADEITMEYYSEGYLHAGLVQAPETQTISLTPFGAMDDAMTPWLDAISADYQFAGPLDDPDRQIEPAVRELVRRGLHPIEAPAEASASSGLAAWTGSWMTRDGSMSELLITDNGNGTLSARAFFLLTAESNAVLTPQADGSMRFETEYGSLIGQMTLEADGTLRLDITGGYSFDDEEATEYYGYFAHGFRYAPAAYEDMWYQTPADAAGPDDDWLGEWTAVDANGQAQMSIRREQGALRLEISLGRYRFSGTLEKESDTVMDLLGDDFSCMLVLNRKLKKIALMEVGASEEGVYDLIGNPYVSVMMFQRSAAAVTVPEEIRDQLDGLPPVSVMPVPTAPGATAFAYPAITPPPAAPYPGLTPPPDSGDSSWQAEAPRQAELLPIPGKPGYGQVPVSRVDATSWIVGKEPNAYTPERMIDGEETTAYQFSTKTTKLGKAYLYFDFDSPVTLDELWMKNGFWKKTGGNDQYTRNCRVKKMTVEFRYASGSGYGDAKTVTLKDDKARKDWKVISLEGRKNVTGVRIRIDEIYTGSKFKNDVCISEIMFVRRDAGMR